MPQICWAAVLAGVRSLAFMDHLLSCGSGRGRLFFFDLRANAYLDVDAASAPGLSSRRAPNLEPSATKGRFLQCGGGYLNQNDTVYQCVPCLRWRIFWVPSCVWLALSTSLDMQRWLLFSRPASLSRQEGPTVPDSCRHPSPGVCSTG